jgi:rod shape-determining protein MreB
MVVDIGGGTTDIAVISLGGIVVSESIKVAGDKMDEAIMYYVRRKYNILIGERTAEHIKMTVGAVYEHNKPKLMKVKGRDLIQGLPREIVISSTEMLEALMDPISAILDGVCSVIERTPPELLGDILKHGIVMTGGGSLVHGFDKLIQKVTGVPVRIAEDPMSCVARGTGIALRGYKDLPEGAINLSRARRDRL